MKENCTTCKWAEWAWTNHAPRRINYHFPGLCLFEAEVENFKMPEVYKEPGIFNQLKRILFSRALWKDEIPESCECWDALDEVRNTK